MPVIDYDITDICAGMRKEWWYKPPARLRINNLLYVSDMYLRQHFLNCSMRPKLKAERVVRRVLESPPARLHRINHRSMCLICISRQSPLELLNTVSQAAMERVVLCVFESPPARLHEPTTVLYNCSTTVPIHPIFPRVAT
jgi:hypothetical protein